MKMTSLSFLKKTMWRTRNEEAMGGVGKENDAFPFDRKMTIDFWSEKKESRSQMYCYDMFVDIVAFEIRKQGVNSVLQCFPWK